MRIVFEPGMVAKGLRYAICGHECVLRIQGVSFEDISAHNIVKCDGTPMDSIDSQCINVTEEEEENGDVVICYVFSQASYMARCLQGLSIHVDFQSGESYQTPNFDVVFQLVLVGPLIFATHPSESMMNVYDFFNCVVHMLMENFTHMRHLYQQCLDVNSLVREQLEKHLLSYPEYDVSI